MDYWVYISILNIIKQLPTSVKPYFCLLHCILDIFFVLRVIFLSDCAQGVTIDNLNYRPSLKIATTSLRTGFAMTM